MHSDLMMNNAVQRYCRGMFAGKTSLNHRIYLYNMMHYNRDGFGIVGLRMPFFGPFLVHALAFFLGGGGISERMYVHTKPWKLLKFCHDFFLNYEFFIFRVWISIRDRTSDSLDIF